MEIENCLGTDFAVTARQSAGLIISQSVRAVAMSKPEASKMLHTQTVYPKK